MAEPQEQQPEPSLGVIDVSRILRVFAVAIGGYVYWSWTGRWLESLQAGGPIESLYCSLDGHLTSEGNRLVAEKLRVFIRTS